MFSRNDMLSRRGLLAGAAGCVLAAGLGAGLASCGTSSSKLVVSAPSSRVDAVTLAARDFSERTGVKMSVRGHDFGTFTSWPSATSTEATADADVVVLDGTEELVCLDSGDLARAYAYVPHEPVFVVAQDYLSEEFSFDEMALPQPEEVANPGHSLTALAIISKSTTGQDVNFNMNALFGERWEKGLARLYYQFCWREGVAEYNAKDERFQVVAVESDALRAHTTPLCLGVKAGSSNQSAAEQFVDYLYEGEALAHFAAVGIAVDGTKKEQIL